jgi:hypothetical protein
MELKIDNIYYTLDECFNPQPIDSPADIDWKDRWDKKTKVGRFIVSTIFLVIDHNYTRTGPPLLFETCVFDGGKYGTSEVVARYSSHKEALKGHDQWCRVAEEAQKEGVSKDEYVRAMRDILLE